jgi:hypothetical protein
LVNMLSGIAAYSHQPKKPSLRWTSEEKSILPVT